MILPRNGPKRAGAASPGTIKRNLARKQGLDLRLVARDHSLLLPGNAKEDLELRITTPTPTFFVSAHSKGLSDYHKPFRMISSGIAHNCAF